MLRWLFGRREPTLVPPLHKPDVTPLLNDDPSLAPVREFHTKVVGVTFANRDGSDRQRIISKCRVGEHVGLVHMPMPDHPNAIAVVRRNGQQIGHLNSDQARRVCQQARGKRQCRFAAKISDLTGGTRKKPTRGVNLHVWQYELGPDGAAARGSTDVVL